ncbi:MAG: UvrD-helicase domain-containing protein [Treponemataceae bacterium]
MKNTLLEGLDEHQKRAVCVEKNAVISAGAGAGKTKVLATRFVYLILEKKYTVDQILTLTFTKKAANEMYDRIYKMLKNYADQGNNDAKKAISDFFSARIMTLDAYCSSLVRHSVYSYGVQPNFLIDKITLQELTYKLALQFIIDHRDNKGMQVILAKNSVSQAAQSFFTQIFFTHSTLSNPINFETFFNIQKSILSEKWKENYLLFLDEISVLTQICTSRTRSKTEQELILFFEKNEIPKTTFTDAALFFPENQLAIKKIIDFSAKMSKFKLTRATKDPLVQIFEILKNLRCIHTQLVSIANYIFYHDDLKELVPLLENFQNQYTNIKRSMGILTFSDVATLALDILKNNISVRTREKQSIQKIMIDEFQDNNNLQKDMLFLLAEKHDRNEKTIPEIEDLRNDVLFFVGDEKQSIYLFRGADVSVFKNLKRELGDENSINLITNYRSNPSLVGSFNFLFGSYLFPSCVEDFLSEQKRLLTPTFFCKKEDFPLEKFPLYESEYSWVKACIKEQHTPKNILFPHVETNFYFEKTITEQEDEEKLSTYEIEAEFVAQKIKTLHEEDKIPFENIAILFRKLTNQHLFETQLRKKNIPYKTDQLTGFFSDSPVNDIYALLRLVIYPHDVHTYATVLTSPFVQMSIISASVCLSHITAKLMSKENFTEEEYLVNNFTPFDSQFEFFLDDEDKIKYQTGRALYEELQQLVTQKSNTDLITYLWYDKGYFYETLWNEEVDSFSSLYDYLFELARRHDEKNEPLSAFIDSVALMIEKSARLEDMDIPIEQKEGVQLMTIHKSKGLEFHSVFLVSVQQESRDSQYKNAAFFSDHIGLAINLPSHLLLSDKKAPSNYFYSIQKNEAEKRSCAELRRLLYVGMTRAEENLFISGSIKVSSKCEFEEAMTIYQKLNLLWEVEQQKREKKEFYIEKSFLDFFFPLLSIDYNTCSINKIQHENAKDSFMPEDYIKRNKSLKQIFDQMHSLPVFPLNPPSKVSFSVTEIAKNNLLKENALSNSSIIANTDYHNLDILITKFKSSFTAADFGTLVHLCIEEALIIDGKTPNFDSFSMKTAYRLEKIKRKIASVTSTENMNLLFSYARKMTETFLQSSTCKEALTANWRESELAFKYLTENDFLALYKKTNPLIINGTIDLIYEKNNLITIVDFKTDKDENKELYQEQLLIYKRAAENMYCKEAKIVLFYTRSGNIK